jgi:heme-degrading monooxygenase HmoA
MSDRDGVTITFELRLKPEAVEVFKGAAAGMLEGAKGFPGFRSIRIVQHKDDPTRILFVERWESEAAYKAYIDWRTGRGEMDGLKAFADGTETNVWPTLAAEAGSQARPAGQDPGVTITFDLRLKPAFVEAFLNGASMQQASQFPGFRGVRLVRHRDDPARALFVERWDSEPAYRAYLDMRAERGEMEGMKTIADRAEITVWPHLLAEA